MSAASPASRMQQPGRLGVHTFILAALVVIVVTVLEVLADEAGAGRVVPAVDVVLGRYATNLHIWVRKRPGRYVDVPRPLFEGLYENHTGPYLSGFDG